MDGEFKRRGEKYVRTDGRTDERTQRGVAESASQITGAECPRRLPVQNVLADYRCRMSSQITGAECPRRLPVQNVVSDRRTHARHLLIHHHSPYLLSPCLWACAWHAYCPFEPCILSANRHVLLCNACLPHPFRKEPSPS